MKRLMAVLCVTGCVSCAHVDNVTHTPYLSSAVVITQQGMITAGLLPYEIPSGSTATMEVAPPKYILKTITINAGEESVSLRKAIGILASRAGVTITVRDGMPKEATHEWDEVRVAFSKNQYTFEAYLREIISYMQELGIPRTIGFGSMNHLRPRVVAIYRPNEVLIDAFAIQPYGEVVVGK